MYVQRFCESMVELNIISCFLVFMIDPITFKRIVHCFFTEEFLFWSYTVSVVISFKILISLLSPYVKEEA